MSLETEKCGGDQNNQETAKRGSPEEETSKGTLREAFKKSGHQIMVMLPVLVGVVLLVGLFKTAVSKATISSVFSGRSLGDAFWGALFGSILAGNPINSYVMGRGLLDVGVSLAGAAAFIFTWASVGLVQLPAEISALGSKFAFVRAAVAFLLSIPIALCTAQFVRLLL